MLYKILTVIGTRPQIIKSALTSLALKKYIHIKEFLLHTGQHYDPNMSENLFEDLKIFPPYKNLNIQQTSHAKQTAEMMKAIETEILEIQPELILVYGDTNSTAAAALTASKLQIPIAHVESGLRSFNKTMPEEINRIITDHLSTFLFTPTLTAQENLKKEGIKDKKILLSGDTTIEVLKRFLPKHKLENKPYYLLTLHRPDLVDDKDKLIPILETLQSSPVPIFFPIHPRTKKNIQSFGFTLPKNILELPPQNYSQIIRILYNAQKLFTDSGGLQKEAAYLQVPCVTLRTETEWSETVNFQWNQCIGYDIHKLREELYESKRPNRPFPGNLCYGAHSPSEFIARGIANYT